VLTIGVEEEYQIVDAQSGALAPDGSRLLHALKGKASEQSANELFLSQIEIGTPVCHTLSEVREQIVRLRRAVIKAAQAHGDLLLASSTHPFAEPTEQRVTPKPRYLDLAENYQQLAREHLICGCHVHVSVHDRELAIEVMNRARGWLAPILALSANSPFWAGEDTGYASFAPKCGVAGRWRAVRNFSRHGPNTMRWCEPCSKPAAFPTKPISTGTCVPSTDSTPWSSAPPMWG
jgi:carboxylate-amine ligase